MKRYLLIMLAWTNLALGNTIQLAPGECILVGNRRICAESDRRETSTEVESITQRGNVFCVCEYGIREVARAGEPMKGYWLRQMQVSDSGNRSEVNLKNFGADERACNIAVTDHPACNVGVTSYVRAKQK